MWRVQDPIVLWNWSLDPSEIMTGKIQFSNTTDFSAFIRHRHDFQLGPRQLLLYFPSLQHPWHGQLVKLGLQEKEWTGLRPPRKSWQSQAEDLRNWYPVQCYLHPHGNTLLPSEGVSWCLVLFMAKPSVLTLHTSTYMLPFDAEWPQPSLWTRKG